MTLPRTDDARRRLLGLRQGSGVWGYRARSVPAAEPSSLAGLALLAEPSDPGDEGRHAAMASAWRLASTCQVDGSLAATADSPETGWPTPLAVLLWSNFDGFEAERSAALGWMLQTEGRAMAPIQDDPIGHDTTIVGWPWVAGTHSWVEPTALALLAMAREGLAGHPRARQGVRLLLDRAIPSGGWNLGNPVVFGTSLRPLPGPTGLALLALASLDVHSEAIGRGLDYLRSAIAETLAPISMGWAVLALRAWGGDPGESASRLDLAQAALTAQEPRSVELAMLLLARGSRSMELMGIDPRGSNLVPGPAPRREKREDSPRSTPVEGFQHA